MASCGVSMCFAFAGGGIGVGNGDRGWPGGNFALDFVLSCKPNCRRCLGRGLGIGGESAALLLERRLGFGSGAFLGRGLGIGGESAAFLLERRLGFGSGAFLAALVWATMATRRCWQRAGARRSCEPTGDATEKMWMGQRGMERKQRKSCRVKK